MRYYGIGTRIVKQKVGKEIVTSTINVILNYEGIVPTTRIEQVRGIERSAKRDRVKLEGIYLMTNERSQRGGIMTKGIKGQKTVAHAKQQRAFKRKIAVAR